MNFGEHKKCAKEIQKMVCILENSLYPIQSGCYSHSTCCYHRINKVYVIEEICKYMEMLYKISRDKVAPMLYQFVSWIIRDAKEKGIERLYFLARDGYVLKLIAERMGTYRITSCIGIYYGG